MLMLMVEDRKGIRGIILETS